MGHGVDDDKQTDNFDKLFCHPTFCEYYLSDQHGTLQTSSSRLPALSMRGSRRAHSTLPKGNDFFTPTSQLFPHFRNQRRRGSIRRVGSSSQESLTSRVAPSRIVCLFTYHHRLQPIGQYINRRRARLCTCIYVLAR
jgi:hypothetical protein